MQAILRIILGAALLACPAFSWASFQYTPFSAKAEAMGGAFVAMADDATSVFLNPAGLATLTSPEAGLMYGKPLYGVEGLDMSQGYTVIGAPLGRRFGLGAGASAFRASGILSEYQTTAGLSARLLSRLAAGVSATYLYHDYEIGKDPAYSGQSVFANGRAKGAFDFNVGFLAFVAPDLNVGVAARNLNRADVGLVSEDRLAREISFGALYRFRRVYAMAELGQRDDATGSSNVWKLGAEVPLSIVSLRCGINSDAMSAGLGLRWGSLQVNYAFTFYSNVDAANYGGQMLALSYRMGGGAGAQGFNDKGYDPGFGRGALIP